MGITTYEIKKDGQPFTGSYYSVDSRNSYEIENGVLMTKDKLYTRVPFIIRPIAYTEETKVEEVKEEVKKEVKKEIPKRPTAKNKKK